MNKLMTSLTDVANSRNVVTLIVLLLIPLFKPYFVLELGTDSLLNIFYFWNAITIIVSVAILILTMRRGSRLQIAFIFTLLGMSAVVLASTLAYEGNLQRWLNYWLPIIGAVLLTVAFCRNCTRSFFKALIVVTVSLSAVNLLSMIVSPGGVFGENIYFYGHRNAAHTIIFPPLICSLLFDWQDKRKISFTTLVIALLGLAQIIVGNSVTSLIAFGALSAGVLLLLSDKIRPFLNLYTFMGLSVASLFLIVVARVQDLLASQIATVLHRSASFSGRSAIWDTTLGLVNPHDFSHFMCGWGVNGFENLVVNGTQYYGPHNMYLDIWLTGGFLSITLFFVLLLIVAYSLFPIRKQKSVALLSLLLGVYFIIGINESILEPSFFIMLSVALCWSAIPHTMSFKNKDISFQENIEDREAQ